MGEALKKSLKTEADGIDLSFITRSTLEIRVLVATTELKIISNDIVIKADIERLTFVEGEASIYIRASYKIVRIEQISIICIDH